MKRQILLTGLLMLAVVQARHIKSDSDPWEDDNANEISSAEEKQEEAIKQFAHLLNQQSFGHGLLNKPAKQDTKTAEKQKKTKQDGVVYRPVKVSITRIVSDEDATGSNPKEDRTLEVVPDDDFIVVDKNFETNEKQVEEAMNSNNKVPVVKGSSQEETEPEVVEKKVPVFTPFKYQRNWPMNIFADIRSYKKNMNRILGQSAVTKVPSQQNHKEKKAEEEHRHDDDDDEPDNEEHKKDDDKEDARFRGARFFFGPQRLVFDTIHGYSVEDMDKEDEPKNKATVEQIPINFSSRQEFSSSVHDMLQRILSRGKKIEASKPKETAPLKKEEDNDEENSSSSPIQTHFKVLLNNLERDKPVGEVKEFKYPFHIEQSSDDVEIPWVRIVDCDSETTTDTTEFSPSDDVTDVPDSENISEKEVVEEESVDEKPETVVSGGSSTSKLSIVGPKDKTETIIESSFSPISFRNLFSNFESSLSDMMARHRAVVLDRLNEAPPRVSTIVPEEASVTDDKVTPDNAGKVVVMTNSEIKDLSTSESLPNFMKSIFGVVLPKMSTSVINFALHPVAEQAEGKETKSGAGNLAPKGKFVMQFRTQIPGFEKQMFPSKLNPFRVDFGNAKIIEV